MATYENMIQRFGIVTVMNVKVYEGAADRLAGWKLKTPEAIVGELEGEEAVCTLDTLKISNLTQEGPNKTITGGRYANPLIKWGKSARCELQDALGNYKALSALGGADINALTNSISIGERFPGPLTLIGDNFFIDQKTGDQVPVKVIIYQFLPDALLNLNQEAEGDASVFDLNGDVLTTEIVVDGAIKGEFYTIINADSVESAITLAESYVVITESKTEIVNVKGTNIKPTVDTSNETVATAVYDSSFVTITAVGAGKATLTVSDNAGNKAYIYVTVKEALA